MLEKSTSSIIAPAQITRQIYLVRGQKVMLDADLAVLYNVETFNLNKAVKRNIERFPKDFMFQLTKQEAENLIFQNGMSSWGGRRHLPYAFTEHGVAMLSSVLRSEQAVQMNIMIIRAFVHVRELLASHKDLAARMEKLETKQSMQGSVLELLVEEIEAIKAPPPLPPKRRIGFITD